MQKKIETDIANIEKCSELREAENWDFRCFLKGSDLSVSKIDSIVKEHYREVSAQIDCTQCANCCKVIQPILKHADIAKLAGHLRLYQKYYEAGWIKVAIVPDLSSDWALM